MISIRFAGPADAPTLHRFICELAAYEKEPDAVEVTPEVLAAQLGEARPPFECLLAEQGERAVGFALFCHNYSTWRGRRGIWLEDLYVPEVLRGQGIGLALLRRLGQVAVERGCGRMEWSVLDWNTPAQGFYRAIGAVALDEWTSWRLTGEALAALGRGGGGGGGE